MIQLSEANGRAALRISGEYVLAWLRAASALFEGDVVLGVTFLTLLRANIRDPRTDAEMAGLPEGQGAPRAPISARMLGLSLSQPRETARRHTARLVDSGWAVREADGLVVPPGVMSSPRAQAISEALFEELGLMTARLAALSGQPAPAMAAGRRNLALLISGDYVLRWAALMSEDRRLSIAPMVYSAVLQSNIRHLIDDPELTARYAGEAPPDEVRRPVSIQAVAEMLGVPRETARQHLDHLVKIGIAVRTSGGHIIPRALLADAAGLEKYAAEVANLRRMVGQLADHGVIAD